MAAAKEAVLFEVSVLKRVFTYTIIQSPGFTNEYLH